METVNQGDCYAQCVWTCPSICSYGCTEECTTFYPYQSVYDANIMDNSVYNYNRIYAG
jgi:hypothetical protein